jgi:hypothetical protein
MRNVGIVPSVSDGFSHETCSDLLVLLPAKDVINFRRKDDNSKVTKEVS